MIDGLPRSATVTAIEPLKAVAIPHVDFEGVIDDDPEFARHLLKTLCARLREAETRASG
jgi:CRP-like cAMP-binding protein